MNVKEYIFGGCHVQDEGEEVRYAEAYPETFLEYHPNEEVKFRLRPFGLHHTEYLELTEEQVETILERNQGWDYVEMMDEEND